MGNICGNKPKKEVNKVEIQKSPSELGDQGLNNVPLCKKSSQIKTQNIIQNKRIKVKNTVKMVKTKDDDGNTMINDYLIMDFLGQGAFGKVKSAIKKDKPDKKYAMKIFKKSTLKRKREFYIDDQGKRKMKDALDDVKREIAIMKKLHHTNIIKLYEVIDNPDQDKLYMVLDFAEGGQLIEWDQDEYKWYYCNEINAENFQTEQQLRTLFRGCIKGLHYLHKNGIVHRDIKPQNILLSSKFEPEIADFGVSTIFQNEDDKLESTQGTYFFMAPETLGETQGFSGKATDMQLFLIRAYSWSLGVTFFCFCFLQLPFFSEDQQELIEMIQEGELKFSQDTLFSQGLEQFLRKMLEKDPTKRINLEQLSKMEWINEGFQSDALIKQMENYQTEQITEGEIFEAVSVATVVMIKHWVHKWKIDNDRKNSLAVKSDDSGRRGSDIENTEQIYIKSKHNQEDSVIQQFDDEKQKESNERGDMEKSEHVLTEIQQKVKVVE